MNDIKSINFFTDDKIYKRKNINILNLILLMIILSIFTVDAVKIYKLKSLEVNINERKQGLEDVNVTNTSGFYIEKIYNTIELVQDNRIENIEIENGILKIEGRVIDSLQIKSIVESIEGLDNITTKPNINAISREGDLYKFEITTHIGAENEG
jgi:hypothetical protein